MPTIDNAIETLQHKRRKYGGNAHCARIIISEEIAEENIANKPDEEGRQKTRWGFETYSPARRVALCKAQERLMPRMSFNPLIFSDFILLLISEAENQKESDGIDGVDIALGMLYKLGIDYESSLREGKAARRKPRNSANPDIPKASIPDFGEQP